MDKASLTAKAEKLQALIDADETLILQDVLTGLMQQNKPGIVVFCSGHLDLIDLVQLAFERAAVELVLMSISTKGTPNSSSSSRARVHSLHKLVM